MKKASPRYAVTSPRLNYGWQLRLAQIYLLDKRSLCLYPAFGERRFSLP